MISQDRAFSRVFGGGLVVSRAPEPEDIIWENLQTSPREQFARQSLSVLVLTVLLVLSVLLLTSVNLFMQARRQRRAEMQRDAARCSEMQ